MKVNESQIGSASTGERLSKSVQLAEAASELKQVTMHLMELQHQLGIHDEPEPVSPNMPMKEPMEPDNSLVHVINILPDQIRMDCSNLHNIITKLQDNLL